MKYKCVHHDYLDKLQELVNKDIELGWEPIGGVAVCEHKITIIGGLPRISGEEMDKQIHHYYIQAMLKRGDNG